MIAVQSVVRTAVPDDLRAIDSVLRTIDEPPPGEPMYPAGAQDPYLGHLIARGTVAVSEVDGVVVGFGATVFNGKATHLADLFVLPAHQGSGHGRRLLAAVFGDRFPRTTFSSDDPRALPLYVRAGMAAHWPNIYISGDPAALPPTPKELDVADATFDDVARLEGGWAGVDRTPEVAFWATHREPRAVIVTRAGRPVAVGFARGRLNGVGRWVDRAMVAPDEDPVEPFLAVLRAGAAGGDLVGACVPGPSPLLPVLLGAGFRIRDRDVFMASDPSLVDPARTLVNTGIL